ncbi:Snf7-domain-containing protein [Coniophora puteana RWD-64-598 SS2]|uniref:Snf7-domain-containing protein n=1 Tax=Coniophora puteana (strain RWD-64-598) TaxID=741705 RepID=A0A5M3N6E2_CONPW|nr:Snf7-domain-containing protein [Coniophora puteana RWD-64-598 SS2]EIW86828.1 Snf7-domain-containing protein [Coniophora puteana RWD-64-598 SS2]
MGANQSVPKITAQDRAVLDLKLQRDKLRQYQKQIQGILDREYEIARLHLAAGHKERATVALRRRKYQQGLLLKTDGQLENLEQLVSTIEFSMIEVSVLHGLKQGNDVLKQIHKEMSIESVEKLMEETAEAREYQQEIGEILSNRLTLDEEDAVQAELAELQANAVRDSKPKRLIPFLRCPRSSGSERYLNQAPSYHPHRPCHHWMAPRKTKVKRRLPPLAWTLLTHYHQVPSRPRERVRIPA